MGENGLIHSGGAGSVGHITVGYIGGWSARMPRALPLRHIFHSFPHEKHEKALNESWPTTGLTYTSFLPQDIHFWGVRN